MTLISAPLSTCQAVTGIFFKSVHEAGVDIDIDKNISQEVEGAQRFNIPIKMSR